MADEKISKELTWKGLKMELEEKELQEIFQQVYEEDEYYNYDILISGLYKALNKEDEAELSKQDKEEGAVSLYSIHKAKGLDFKVVIIPDFDLKLNRPATKPKIISIFDKENILLGFNSYQLFTNKEDKKFSDPMYEYLIRDYTLANLEEEIRILYVAMTRAKYLLVLANKDSKFFNNVEFNRNLYIVSYLRWLSEIDSGEFIKKFEKN